MESTDFSRNQTSEIYEKISSENFIFPNKISITYSFNDSINRVWKVLKDFERCSPEFSDLRSSCEFIVGKNTYELNNEFKISWNDNSTLLFKCVKISDEEYMKKIFWRVHAPEYNIYYKHSYILHSNTIEKNCILIWDITYEEPEKLPFTKETLIFFHKIFLDSCKKYENLIKKSLDDLIQIESVIINKDRGSIWKLITNWKDFTKVVPKVADTVHYEGNTLEINTVITLKFIARAVECKLKVVSVSNNPEDEKWEYILECIDGKPKVPKQNLIFSFLEISDHMTFLSFKHEFLQSVKFDMVESISDDKKIILSELKNFFEETGN